MQKYGNEDRWPPGQESNPGPQNTNQDYESLYRGLYKSFEMRLGFV